MSKRPPPTNLGLQYTFDPRDVRRGQTYNPPGFRYSSSKSKPCDDKYGRLERGCKAQLAFRDGQPLLRFCKERGQPGVLVPVNQAEEAVAIGQQGCATGIFPNSIGLGRVRSRRR